MSSTLETTSAKTPYLEAFAQLEKDPALSARPAEAGATAAAAEAVPAVPAAGRPVLQGHVL